MILEMVVWGFFSASGWWLFNKGINVVAPEEPAAVVCITDKPVVKEPAMCPESKPLKE